MFLKRGTSVGKSHLTKTICMVLTKTMSVCSKSPELKILILAPTEVTAGNIDGTNINSGLGIPPFVNDYTLPRLSY